MKNIKLIIEYDGTNYSGWQIQDNSKTIQGVLENALYKITREKIRLIGSGRTDAGVHAKGQTANFKTYSKIPPEKVAHALNSLLPPDIRVISSSIVDYDFHSRYSVKKKRYIYKIHNSHHGTAIDRDFCYHVRGKLNIDKMETAAKYFVGEYDFESFHNSGSSVMTTVRKLLRSEIITDYPYIYYITEGEGYLYNMVRIITGTLIEVGLGKLDALDIPQIIQSRDRKMAGFTAPAKGLYLDQVFY